MSIKLIGSVLVILGCGGFGFSLAVSYRREVKTIRQLIGLLGYMESELRYRLTPLPQLCRQTAAESRGVISRVINRLAEQLEAQVSPNVSSCMCAVISEYQGDIPIRTQKCLEELGMSLGRFDLAGQLTGLESVRQSCKDKLEELENNKENRLRSYQTLSLCAGAALAILLI